jgi:hypothetical protein
VIEIPHPIGKKERVENAPVVATTVEIEQLPLFVTRHPERRAISEEEKRRRELGKIYAGRVQKVYAKREAHLDGDFVASCVTFQLVNELPREVRNAILVMLYEQYEKIVCVKRRTYRERPLVPRRMIVNLNEPVCWLVPDLHANYELNPHPMEISLEAGSLVLKTSFRDWEYLPHARHLRSDDEADHRLLMERLDQQEIELHPSSTLVFVHWVIPVSTS